MSPFALLRARSFPAIFLTFLLIAPHLVALEWKMPPEKITLLAVNAHPDDEGIFFGGALPYYSGILQVPTMLLSMTSGDWNTNNLLIRENELRNAAWTYGLRYEPIFARFRDVPSHNMAGNPYTNKIDATWDYWADGILQGDGSDVAAGHAKAVNYVAEIIRRYRPEVIITHDFNGEYGHDNHKATALVVSEAYYVAADPSATATNLVGLAPWQARKLYVHLYKTNQLFHTEWETPRPEFAGKSARQIANDGLDAHVSQSSPDVSTYYLSGENYDGYDSERWGLFASAVGPDTVTTNGTFFEHIDLTSATNRSPEFFPKPVRVLPAMMNQPYVGQTLARFATDMDKVTGDTLTFSKISGPSWLNVAANGALSGTPAFGDVGENLFSVRVTDFSSNYDGATLRVVVGGRLAGSWNCNEGTGPTADDTSGEGHHATLSVGSAWIIGRDQGALKFDGTNGFATSDNVNVATELTVAAWICSSNLVGEHAILGEATGYTLKTSGTSLRFTTPGIKDHAYAANFATGQWFHVAVTFEAGVSNGCKFYINGQFRGATNASTKNITANSTWIGRNQWGQYFSGLLDDVRIYRVALNASEIAALYANHTPVFGARSLLFPGAMEQASYPNQTLAPHVTDPDASDTLTFRKVSGADWLNVTDTGDLSGTPMSVDVGTNRFQVQVTDSQNAVAEATLQIIVAYQPTFRLGVAGMDQGRAHLMFTAEALQNYQILGSSNLVTWIPIVTISTDTLGRALWSDPTARSNSFFYRVQQ